MQKVFLRLREMIIEFPDGFAFGVGRLEPITSGWVVKVNGHGNYEGEEGMKQALEIAHETTMAVAGYKDGEVELWDVIEVFDDETMATVAGIANDQMSIYQIETGRLKWLE